MVLIMNEKGLSKIKNTIKKNIPSMDNFDVKIEDEQISVIIGTSTLLFDYAGDLMGGQSTG